MAGEPFQYRVLVEKPFRINYPLTEKYAHWRSETCAKNCLASSPLITPFMPKTFWRKSRKDTCRPRVVLDLLAILYFFCITWRIKGRGEKCLNGQIFCCSSYHNMKPCDGILKVPPPVCFPWYGILKGFSFNGRSTDT